MQQWRRRQILLLSCSFTCSCYRFLYVHARAPCVFVSVMNWTDWKEEDSKSSPFDLPAYKWCLVIAYDGTHFSGWQYQSSTLAIQCYLEGVLTQITKLQRENLHLVGAGRTDAEVHAWGQVCVLTVKMTISESNSPDKYFEVILHFQMAHFIMPFNYDNLDTVHKALNGLLPSDIRVRQISSAVPEFHAHFSVTSKIYHYKIYSDTIMDPFQRHYAYYIVYKLYSDIMRDAAKHFIGKHDFSAFGNASRNDRVPNPVKRIFCFDVIEVVISRE